MFVVLQSDSSSDMIVHTENGKFVLKLEVRDKKDWLRIRSQSKESEEFENGA